MTPKKIVQLVLLNTLIIIINISVFSNAFLGFSLFAGTALTMSVGWFTLIASVFSFSYFNRQILIQKPTYKLLGNNVKSLDDFIGILEEAKQNGDVFDKNIIKNINQLKRFRKKEKTIRESMLQKFSPQELTYQKFDSVLNNIEKTMCLNMSSILSKMAAFDVEEYESLQKKNFPKNEVSEEKMQIYDEYLKFIKNATSINEDILLKMDKMLLEISSFNSLENDEVKELPALAEMDELIKNASLYK